MEKIDKLNIKNSPIYFYESDKYKKANIQIQFEFKAEETNLLALKILSALLTCACNEYNSIPAMSNYLESLYGTTIYGDVSIVGETAVFILNASYLSELYTEKGNTGKVIDLMSKMIYEPNLKNEHFEKEYYKMIIDRIVNVYKNALEKKENYALSQYSKMFEGTLFHQLEIIDIQKVLKMTQKEIMEAYQMLLNAPLKVFVTGDNDRKQILELLEKHFNFDSKKIDISYNYPITEYKEAKVEKNKKYSQSFLVMLYKHDIFENQKDYYKIVIANAVLNNKLFKQVREKNGLCYMIFARNLKNNGVLEVLTGIEAENYRKATRIIEKQFEALKQGKITKKEFKMAKESVIGSNISAQDSLNYMVKKLVNYSRYNEFINTETILEELKKVTIEDVIEVISNTKYLTHYFLKGVGENE